MITWMQRHKKYLIVTIWVSTIAFVGAGFVGWGQFDYKDKAGAVAKVGDIEISMGALQKQYSSLYNQYNQIFQGNFDEEKAKGLGLQQQALKQLLDQAYLLNLAKEYGLTVTSSELLSEIKAQEYFFKDGVFDKELYREILTRNNFSIAEYEEDVEKQILIQKTLALLPVELTNNEQTLFNTLSSIADKIEYKVLDDKDIKVDTSDEKLKPYWENVQQNYLTEVSYDVRFIKHKKQEKTFTQDEIEKFYTENKMLFKDLEGKIIPIEDATQQIIEALLDKENKNEALREYIAFKKNELPEDVAVETTTISVSKNPFTDEILEEISKLSPTAGFMKPTLINGSYITFELTQINPAQVQSYEEAKQFVVEGFIHTQKRETLLSIAKNSYQSFKGDKTDFITQKNSGALKNLNISETREFLNSLFKSSNKQGFISLQNGKIVIYHILEQKLLENLDTIEDETMLRLKSEIFSQGLLKNLQNKYPKKIYIEGL
ncbi:MAG: peptidylprolyl isomerase [Sulfurimonadaceae bacterium]|jgi:peptidyl-prolyl cis-trans isomerase D|nr:peptidylprolyl isomerase [Sulfurimonadaceae bacterium]